LPDNNDMTFDSQAIVNPVKGKKSPTVGPTVILAGTQTDLRFFVETCFSKNIAPYPLYLGSVFQEPEKLPGLTVAGPILGAPFAAMMLETLIAWGAARVFFMGWCGAVSSHLSIGDVVVPDRCIIDEGTSRHYPSQDALAPCCPTGDILSLMTCGFESCGIPFHKGPIWTTDAIFRETRDAVENHQKNGILAVEMEFSALCSIARFRGIELAGAMVVSDRLADFVWQPGFKNPNFVHARKMLGHQLVKTALS
jgi:uridine phosphorylase